MSTAPTDSASNLTSGVATTATENETQTADSSNQIMRPYLQEERQRLLAAKMRRPLSWFSVKWTNAFATTMISSQHLLHAQATISSAYV
jgi:hypothetical protein